MQQSVLKKISSEYSLEGMMLKLKLQYFGHLMWRTDSLEKTLMLGKIEDRGEGDDRGWDGWMASPTWWTWVWVSSGSWWWTGKPRVLQSMGSQRSQIWLRDWSELNWTTNQNNSGKVRRREEMPCVLPTSQNPHCWHQLWLVVHATKDPESEWLARDNLETNPITIKAETVSQIAEQFSWVPLPCCSPPRSSFSIVSCFGSTHVSSDSTFLSVWQEPTLGPPKGSPFL